MADLDHIGTKRVGVRQSGSNGVLITRLEDGSKLDLTAQEWTDLGMLFECCKTAVNWEYEPDDQ